MQARRLTTRLLAGRGESPPQARARDFSLDRGAKPQTYWSISRIWQHRDGGKDPLAARRDFCHGLLGIVLIATAGPAEAIVTPVAAVSCGALVDGRCYSSGAFELILTSVDVERFKVCRSFDTTGWGGCDVLVSDAVPAVNGQGTIAIAGDHLPADGLRRAYYVSACDAAGACTPWRDNDEVYVYRDTSVPDPQSVTTAADWIVDDGSVQQIVATVTDAASGVGEVRLQINREGANAGQPRGLFAWHRSVFRFAADRVECVGGGFASKHPKLHRPTTVTLVGCHAAETADALSVTFEIEPNPTFGARTAAHDVSLRTFDRVDNRSSWRSFDLDFSSSRPGDEPGEGIGYQGILDAAGLDQALAEGIGPNLATLLYQRKTCAPFYWRNVDTAGILDAYRQHGVQAMVILENFLFRDVNDPQGDDCLPLDPPPPFDPSPCFADSKWRRFPDWRARLDEFAALHGAHLTAEDVAFFLVSSEVNDRCFDLAEVEEVAFAVRERFPAVPLAMIYGATHRPGDELESQPPPPFLPAIFDVVGLFAYEVFDVNDPFEGRNVTASYYDPQRPENPSTVYGDLLAKRHPHQRVMLVFDANFNGRKQSLGWLPEDLATVARNYADFMAHRPEVTMMGGFTWQGLLALPESVRDVHRQLVCERFDNASPLCAAP